jgi:hypothetical protein
MSIRPFYDRWPQYNRRLTEVIGAMTDEGLAIKPAPDLWPIWGTVGHTAAARVYWLCHVVWEPGHSGELSQTLGIHDLPQIDLWRPD